MITLTIIIIAIISFTAGTIFGVYGSMRAVKAVAEGHMKKVKL